MPELKICVVGSGGVGKSCCTVRFLKKKFEEYYDPTIEESYRKQVKLDGVEHDVEIVDTAGQEEFASYRDSSLSYGDGFLLVYGINSQSSWDDLKELRTKILKVKDVDAFPMVIIGNKCDLTHERVVGRSVAEEYCRQHAVPYLETSAKTGENIDRSFYEVLNQIRTLTPEKTDPNRSRKGQGFLQRAKEKCSIL